MLERYATLTRTLLAASPGPERAAAENLLESLRGEILGLRAQEAALEPSAPARARRQEIALLRQGLTTLWHDLREALDGPAPLRRLGAFGHGCAAFPSSACPRGAQGTLLVTDFGQAELLEYRFGGELLRAHPLGLKDPTRVLSLDGGRFLICDRGNSRLLVLDPDLRLEKTIPFPPAPDGRRPYDVARLGAEVAVMSKDAAHDNPRWHLCAPDGDRPEFTPLQGPATPAPVNCVGAAGALYVTAGEPNALLRHTPSDGSTTVLHREPLDLWPTKVEPRPGGLWCCAEGRLVRLDWEGNVLWGARVAALAGAHSTLPGCLCSLHEGGRERLVVGDGVGRCLHLLEIVGSQTPDNSR